MATHAERCLAGVLHQTLKLAPTTASPTAPCFWVPRRFESWASNFEVGGMRYLDLKPVERKRDPNDPSRAKIPGGPKLGVNPDERVPYTYGGKITPHYHVFRQLWPEPTLFKRKFGPKVDVKEAPPTLEHVAVPLRKARSSTAVLSALSSTVRVEAATVPYDLLDDPYLLPMKDFHSRDYRTARASGRRVAKRIVEDFPHFFDLKFLRPSPVVEALEPGPSDWTHQLGEDDSIDLNDVIAERLEAGRYDLAFEAYEMSVNKEAELSADVLVSLFQIAAWHNLNWESNLDVLRPSDAVELEENHLDMELGPRPESAYLMKWTDASREDVWRPEGIAEDLWRRIPKTDALHCAFVQALVRHGATKRAYDHFLTLIDEGIVVDLPTFNALLTWHNEINSQVDGSTQGEDHDWEYRRILWIMAERGVAPTTATFNAVLHGLQDRRLPYRKNNVESVMIEMIDLRLRPTLGTLALALKSWRVPDDAQVRHLDWILKTVEAGVDVTDADNYDDLFFPVIIFALRNERMRFAPGVVEMAHRVHALSQSPDYGVVAKRKMFAFRLFVKDYLQLLAENGRLDDAMRVFSTYVPNFVQLRPRDYGDFLKNVADLAPVPVHHVVTLGNELSHPVAFGDERTSDVFVSMLSPTNARDASELRALVAVAANYFRAYVEMRTLHRKKQDTINYAVHGPAMIKRDPFYLSAYAFEKIFITLGHGEDDADVDLLVDAFFHYVDEMDQIRGAPPVEGAFLMMRRVAESETMTNRRKGRVLIEAIQFLNDVGAHRQLVEGLDLMVEHVTLDETSALIVAQLQDELKGREKRWKAAETA